MEMHIYFPFQSFRAFEVRSEFHLTVGQRGCEGERERWASDRWWQTKIPGREREREGEEGKKGGGMTRLRDRWRLSSRRLSPGRQTADLRSEPQRERDGNKRTRGNMKKCQVGRRWFLFLTLWRSSILLLQIHTFACWFRPSATINLHRSSLSELSTEQIQNVVMFRQCDLMGRRMISTPLLRSFPRVI